MPGYEYKVVPAPTKGRKVKGIRGAEARFSHALEALMNELAGQGWEYQRAETLPSLERSGLTSTTTEWRNLLVFRRPRNIAVEALAPELLPAPEQSAADAGEKTEDTRPASPGAANAATAPGDAVRLVAEKSWKERVEDNGEAGPAVSHLEKWAGSRNRPKSDD